MTDTTTEWLERSRRRVAAMSEAERWRNAATLHERFGRALKAFGQTEKAGRAFTMAAEAHAKADAAES